MFVFIYMSVLHAYVILNGKCIKCGYCFISQGQLLVVISALALFARSDSDTGLEDILGIYRNAVHSWEDDARCTK